MKAVHVRRPRLVAVLLAVLLLIGLAPVARAQMGMGMDVSQFSAPVNRRSLDDYAKLLGLTADQKDALKSLYDSYLTSHSEAMKEMQKVMADAQEKMQDTGDFKAFQKEMPKKMQVIGAKVEKLETGFYDDTKSLLNTEQQASWPKVERHRRREKGLRFGFLSGQAVDLVRVVNTLKIDPASVPGLADQMDRYEADMDRAIAAFEKFGKEQEKRQEEFADFDMTKMQEMMGKVKEMMKSMLDISKGMRDVNRQYARSIQPLLPEEQRPKFDAEFNRRSYPRIYRESYVNKVLAAASGFDDATADQKQQLAEIKAEYAREVDAANKRWASATDEREDKTGGQFMEMMDMWGGPGGNEAVKETANKARDDRKDLDKRYKEKLLSLLTEDQKGRLPEEKKEQSGMFGMMGGEDMMAVPDEESK